MVISKRVGSKGFTIVELLIVVVIIAILAAITLVTYNGIQQRANNAAIIDAASKSLRMIQAYISANTTLPYTSASASDWLCVTVSSGCVWSSGSVPVRSAFNTNISTIGTVPSSVPVVGTDRYGIIYYWNSSWTLSGVSRPAILIYWLQGTNQQCGVQGVIVESGATLSPSTTGYTVGSDSGKTRCEVSIPGPDS